MSSSEGSPVGQLQGDDMPLVGITVTEPTDAARGAGAPVGSNPNSRPPSGLGELRPAPRISTLTPSTSSAFQAQQSPRGSTGAKKPTPSGLNLGASSVRSNNNSRSGSEGPNNVHNNIMNSSRNSNNAANSDSQSVVSPASMSPADPHGGDAGMLDELLYGGSAIAPPRRPAPSVGPTTPSKRNNGVPMPPSVHAGVGLGGARRGPNFSHNYSYAGSHAGFAVDNSDTRSVANSIASSRRGTGVGRHRKGVSSIMQMPMGGSMASHILADTASVAMSRAGQSTAGGRTVYQRAAGGRTVVASSNGGRTQLAVRRGVGNAVANNHSSDSSGSSSESDSSVVAKRKRLMAMKMKAREQARRRVVNGTACGSSTGGYNSTLAAPSTYGGRSSDDDARSFMPGHSISQTVHTTATTNFASEMDHLFTEAEREEIAALERDLVEGESYEEMRNQMGWWGRWSHPKKKFKFSSLYLFSVTNPIRGFIFNIHTNRIFEGFIILNIVANTIVMAFTDPKTDENRPYEDILDIYFTVVFTVEMLMKIVSLGFVLHRGAYLRSGWNVLDFFIVILAYVNYLPGMANLTALRSIRVLRPLRSMNAIGGLRFIVVGLMKSVAGLVHVMSLLGIVFLIFGIAGTQLWMGTFRNRCVPYEEFLGGVNETDNSTIEPLDRANWTIGDFCKPGNTPGAHVFGYGCPADEACLDVGNDYANIINFDSFIQSCITLFVLMTFEGWPTYLINVYDVWGEPSFIYFFFFLMFAAFFIPNLALAVINEKFVEVHNKFLQEEEIEQLEAEQKAVEAMEKAAKETEERIRNELTAANASSAEALALGGSARSVKVTPTEEAALLASANKAAAVPLVGQPGADDTTAIIMYDAPPVGLGAGSDDEAPKGAVTVGGGGGAGVDVEMLHIVAPRLLQTPSSAAAGAGGGISPNDSVVIGGASLIFDSPDDNEALLQAMTPFQRALHRYDTFRRFIFRHTEGYEKPDGSVEGDVAAADELNHKITPYIIIMMGFILLNSILLASQHYEQPDWLTDLQNVGNKVLTGIFAADCAIRLFALGFKLYFTELMNWIDFGTTVASIVELFVGGSSIAVVFRSFRLFRVFKLFRNFESLQKILRILVTSMQDTGFLFVIVLLFIYMAALVGMQMFGKHWEDKVDGDRAGFQTFFRSVVTVFQLMTFDGWDILVVQAVEVTGYEAVIYFVVVLLIGNYLILQLFLAILIGAFEEDDMIELFEKEEEKMNGGALGAGASEEYRRHFHRTRSYQAINFKGRRQGGGLLYADDDDGMAGASNSELRSIIGHGGGGGQALDASARMSGPPRRVTALHVPIDAADGDYSDTEKASNKKGGGGSRVVSSSVNNPMESSGGDVRTVARDGYDPDRPFGVAPMGVTADATRIIRSGVAAQLTSSSHANRNLRKMLFGSGADEAAQARKEMMLYLSAPMARNLHRAKQLAERRELLEEFVKHTKEGGHGPTSARRPAAEHSSSAVNHNDRHAQAMNASTTSDGKPRSRVATPRKGLSAEAAGGGAKRSPSNGPLAIPTLHVTGGSRPTSALSSRSHSRAHSRSTSARRARQTPTLTVSGITNGNSGGGGKSDGLIPALSLQAPSASNVMAADGNANGNVNFFVALNGAKGLGSSGDVAAPVSITSNPPSRIPSPRSASASVPVDGLVIDPNAIFSSHATNDHFSSTSNEALGASASGVSAISGLVEKNAHNAVAGQSHLRLAGASTNHRHSFGAPASAAEALLYANADFNRRRSSAVPNLAQAAGDDDDDEEEPELIEDCEICNQPMLPSLPPAPLVSRRTARDIHQRMCLAMSRRAANQKFLDTLDDIIDGLLARGDGDDDNDYSSEGKLLDASHYAMGGLAASAMGVGASEASRPTREVIEHMLGAAWSWGLMVETTPEDLMGPTWGPMREAIAMERKAVNLMVGEERVGRAFLSSVVGAFHIPPVETNGGWAFFVLGPKNPLRVLLTEVLANKWFERFILFCIIVSSLLLAFDTPRDPNPDLVDALHYFDIVFTAIFAAEMVMKVIALGLAFHKGAYLRDGWNWLDGTIVTVSIISLSIASVDVGFLKVLRVFRALRPLRLITRNRGIQEVVLTLFKSAKGILNVVVVAMLNYSIFAILGVQLFGGTFYRCNDDTITLRVDCVGTYVNQRGLVKPRLWTPSARNFDNFGNALLALFEVSTTEWWLDVLWDSVDSVSKDEALKKDNNIAYAIFYIVFIIIASHVMLNMFVGVMISSFNSVKAQLDGISMLTDDQRLWGEAQRILLNFKPSPHIHAGRFKISKIMFSIVTDKRFEFAIFGCVVLNIIVLACDHYQPPQAMADALSILNDVFSAIFIAEVVAKIIAMELRYFLDSFSRLDFILVLISIANFSLRGRDIVNMNVLQVLRVFRILRIFRIVKKAKQIRILMEALWYSLPSLANVAGLMLVLMFLYCVMAVQLFDNIDSGEMLDDKYENFFNVWNAFGLFFRFLTVEDWNTIMHDCMVLPPFCDDEDDDMPDCGNAWAPLFFVSFLIFGTYFLMNLIVAIILDNFNTTSHIEKSQVRMHDINKFMEVWSELDPNATLVIGIEKLPYLLTKLRPPLGIPHAKSRYEMLQQCRAYEIPIHDGKIHFYETLIPLARTTLAVEMPRRTLREQERAWREAMPDLMKLPVHRLITGYVATVDMHFAAVMIQSAHRRRMGRRIAEWRREQRKIDAGRVLERQQSVVRKSLLFTGAVEGGLTPRGSKRGENVDPVLEMSISRSASKDTNVQHGHGAAVPISATGAKVLGSGVHRRVSASTGGGAAGAGGDGLGGVFSVFKQSGSRNPSPSASMGSIGGTNKNATSGSAHGSVKGYDFHNNGPQSFRGGGVQNSGGGGPVPHSNSYERRPSVSFEHDVIGRRSPAAQGSAGPQLSLPRGAGAGTSASSTAISANSVGLLSQQTYISEEANDGAGGGGSQRGTAFSSSSALNAARARGEVPTPSAFRYPIGEHPDGGFTQDINSSDVLPGAYPAIMQAVAGNGRSSAPPTIAGAHPAAGLAAAHAPARRRSSDPMGREGQGQPTLAAPEPTALGTAGVNTSSMLSSQPPQSTSGGTAAPPGPRVPITSVGAALGAMVNSAEGSRRNSPINNPLVPPPQ